MSTQSVIELGRTEILALRVRLEAEGYSLGEAPHAHFRAWSEGVHVTAYRSGKVVVQGRGTDPFVSRFLKDGRSAPADPLLSEAVVGCDESGKGDYFGPLVVAACLVDPERHQRLQELNICDSKRASDQRIQASERWIREIVPHAVILMMPEEYNAAHQRDGNLNILLGRAHARAIEAVLEQEECQVALCDKFGDERHVRQALGSRGAGIRVIQRPRAEAHPAVAAASFLARAVFLEKLRELEEKTVGRLPKGAGREVEEAAREILQLQGPEVLKQVAKWHFRITDRL